MSLIDAKTGLGQDIGLGLVWLVGGLGGDADIVERSPLAFQANAFQFTGFQMNFAYDAFQATGFQNNAFQQGGLEFPYDGFQSSPVAFQPGAFQQGG